jgi:hypothetical protein
MKRFILMALTLIAFGPGISWGQVKQPLAAGQASSTSQGNPKSASAKSGSNIHSVSLLLMAQKRQIRNDLHSGKLTKEQAQTAWENLKTARKQELEFQRQNGQKEITDDQKTQLNETLAKNTGSI